MRSLSLRLVEELPLGCLDGAQAWAARELGQTLEAAPSAALAVVGLQNAGSQPRASLYSPAAGGQDQGGGPGGGPGSEAAAGWDLGCGGLNRDATLAVWDSYKTFSRRAAVLNDAIAGV
jgi:hypothetical protein